MKIVDAKDVKKRPRKAPATRMIEQLPDGLYSARQVADKFGVNIETIRRLARATNEKGKPKFKAPSKAARSGELVIWVYTEADLDELAEYFGDRGRAVRKVRKSP